MDLNPLCEGARALGHSAPGLKWWLSLTAADQGAWIAGIGASAAALAALYISGQERRRRTSQSRDVARLGASYMVTDLQRLVVFVAKLKKNLRELAASPPPDGDPAHGKAIETIKRSLEEISPILNRIGLDRLSMLPPKVGANLAVTLGGLPICCDGAKLLLDRLSQGDLVSKQSDNLLFLADSLEGPLQRLIPFFQWFSIEFPGAIKLITDPMIQQITDAIRKESQGG